MNLPRADLRVVAVVAASALCWGLAACTGSGSDGPASDTAPAPALGAPFSSCPASVTVPTATDMVVPKATGAPVAQLVVGEAVSFAAGSGARVRPAGPATGPEGQVLCLAERGASTILVGTHRGYVRVGVETASGSRRYVLVRVTD